LPSPGGLPSTVTQAPFPFLEPPEHSGDLGKLGTYRIQKVLGKGGMGMVLLGHDSMLDRQVAIKIMQPEVATPDNRDRFFREARATAALHHDHIVPIFQIGEASGVPFLVMPFLQGEALDRRLAREKKPPLRETVRIIRETATGLMAAHDKGMVHRDIKPGNIWLEAPRGRVRILDFGLARTASTEVKITQVGAIMGTPAYMSPEQAGGRDVDFRADLFSLGVILYEMLTGKRPFPGNDALAILSSLLTTTPQAPAVIDPAIPQDISRLALVLIHKDPQKRPGSARDVAVFLSRQEKALAQSNPVPTVSSPGGASSPKSNPPTPAPSPPTPADQDRIFDTKMIQEAIPADLLAQLGAQSSRMEPPLISLRLLKGSLPPNSLKGEKIVIGRATGSTLRIQSSQVSRTHAQVLWSPLPQPHYTIEDLGSTNGTFINDAKVLKATPLLPGDRLHLGALGFQIEYPLPEKVLKELQQTRAKSGVLGKKREPGEESQLDAADLIRVVDDSAPSHQPVPPPLTKVPKPNGPGEPRSGPTGTFPKNP